MTSIARFQQFTCRYLLSVSMISGDVSLVITGEYPTVSEFQRVFNRQFAKSFKKHCIDYSLFWAPSGYQELPSLEVTELEFYFQLNFRDQLQVEEDKWAACVNLINHRTEEELRYIKMFA
jgi:hypothetical protein